MCITTNEHAFAQSLFTSSFLAQHPQAILQAMTKVEVSATSMQAPPTTPHSTRDGDANTGSQIITSTGSHACSSSSAISLPSAHPMCDMQSNAPTSRRPSTASDLHASLSKRSSTTAIGACLVRVKISHTVSAHIRYSYTHTVSACMHTTHTHTVHTNTNNTTHTHTGTPATTAIGTPVAPRLQALMPGGSSDQLTALGQVGH